jgi:hypothetical protein
MAVSLRIFTGIMVFYFPPLQERDTSKGSFFMGKIFSYIDNMLKQIIFNFELFRFLQKSLLWR